jgi:GR25 family glycosyltransferase involved in LPS biosynthesis
LADQLTVNPDPLVPITDEARQRTITMTRQEIAVALSHIEVWRLIADGDAANVLVLEDDVFMAAGFARSLARTWSSLAQQPDGFDLLYLAYRDVGKTGSTRSRKGAVRRTTPGVWEASAYVLSKQGARVLLARLPTFGPIDLWMNFQFDSLRVFTTPRPIVEQRMDDPSSNAYSVLPVLSQVGAITREKPLVHHARRLPGPLIAVGPAGSGLTALATALSMLGYTCVSEVAELPAQESARLLSGSTGNLFNAYVNIGELDAAALQAIVRTNPRARFITTDPLARTLVPADRLLHLPHTAADPWESLVSFLGLDYPAFTYPATPDQGQQLPDVLASPNTLRPVRRLKADASPWVLAQTPARWAGITVAAPPAKWGDRTSWHAGDTLTASAWHLRNDTFPSNLALFRPENIRTDGPVAVLELRRERTSVREFTAGAIASRSSFCYGSFSAELRPSNVSGVITGIFLHRNAPRQEIDIEFLGRDTTRMLVNVYYNPGPDGTKLEYGYRGTPVEIELGFDAASDFHRYEIEWLPGGIRWKVDDAVVYERRLWDPTPIPDQPLEYNINLWHSRSVEFAGKLESSRLPATTEVRIIEIVPLRGKEQ